MSIYKVPEFISFEFQKPVEDKDLNTPPTATKGKRYIVGPSPTGDWAGQSGNIAIGNGSGWDFVSKKEGMLIYIKDEDKFYKYISSWSEYLGQQGPTGPTGSTGATGPTGPAGSSGTVTRGTFVNGNLSSGKLTLTHNKSYSAPYTIAVVIFDNNNKQIIPDDVEGATNTVIIDLSSFGTISGTWGYAYIV